MIEKVASKAYKKQLSPLLKEHFEGQNKKAFLREHAIAAFRKSGICPLSREEFQMKDLARKRNG